MSVLKIILLFFLLLFAISIIRLLIIVFKFSRFMKKARSGNENKSSGKKPAGKSKYSKDGNTITLGKDDYHVD
jgi:hypothetical protein